jgi:WXG100 family type VII secretion target
MADKQFMVRPDEVQKSVEAIIAKATDFGVSTDKLYSEAEALSTQWKGATSEAFNSDLQGYRETIGRLQKSLAEYCKGVTESMNTYIQTDNELADEAKALGKRG